MLDERRERYINPYTDFGFKKFFEQAEIAKYSESERRQYEASQKEYWDYTSTLETVEHKGETKEKRATAQRMKADGLPIDMIAKYTQLSPEQIEKI